MPSKQTTSRALQERLPSYGVLILESHHSPRFSMEWRTHPFHKLIFAPQGQGSVWIDDEPHRFEPGSLIVVPAGLRNRVVDDPGEPVSLYILCIARRLLAFDGGIERRLPTGGMPASGALSERAGQHFRRLLYEQRRDRLNKPLSLVSGALGLLELVLDEGEASELEETAPSMAAYVRYLDANFYEAKSVDAEAARVGLSRRVFTQRFREATGRSWLDYVRDRAIQYACELLRDTRMPVVSIAFECGFADLTTFYRQFKSRTGTSPAAWRRENLDA